MDTILKDINAVVGVTGSFVCDDEGEIVARALPSVFGETMLSPVGRTMAQTITGLRIARRQSIGDVDLVYGEGRLIIKNVGEGCLCILCVRRVNVPLLNLTANVAAKKLAERLKEIEAARAEEQAAQAEAQPEAEPEEQKPKMSLAEAMAATIRR